ncbi:hypothetical protein JI58_06925 [Marinosulfonomonas sp. PRT-SC04]|nr:hypothetical protein JI58_06925 [Marinosulfonomonas sp. PRT-SC04]
MQNKNLPPASPQKGQLVKITFTGDSDIDLLAQTLGQGIALLLIEHFGGFELRVPKEMREDHDIAKRIGYDNACALSKYAGGGRLYIPCQPPTAKLKRDQIIVQMIEAGKTRPEIARHLGMSTRNLQRIITKLGLSGQTCVLDKRREASKAPESKSNGGLTGGISDFTTQSPPKPQTPPDGVVSNKHGYYQPQTQKDMK